MWCDDAEHQRTSQVKQSGVRYVTNKVVCNLNVVFTFRRLHFKIKLHDDVSSLLDLNWDAVNHSIPVRI